MGGMVPSVPLGGAVIGIDAAPAGFCSGVTSAPEVAGARPRSLCGGGGAALLPLLAPGLES